MKVVRTSQVEWAAGMKQGAFEGRRKPLGEGKLGCSLWELPPGKRSFPLHSHHITEEALYVVSGSAKVRTPSGETAIGPGDFVSFPAGGEAHQLVNDGTAALIYLGMSATLGVDIVEYPDSGKIACSVGAYPQAKRFIFRAQEQVPYFDGEKDAEPGAK